jgi:poly(A) polymerase
MNEPRIIQRQDHPISRKDIDKDSLRVLYTLKDAGYEAYLVGGAVRDLLMGRKPKDFDVATDARPRDLRRLFRNSREVGRRFRIVHVFFGPKNVEVATLRSQAEPADDGYIDDDNQWGDLESDSWRRDFTINALYYDIRDFAVIDHTGGMADLNAQLVRSIGDPFVRFREDPVRMLRAIKFAARFGYAIEAETEQALHDLAPEILKASRFRVIEEIFRIIGQANRHRGIEMLGRYGFLGILFPDWLDAVGEEGLAQVEDYFRAVDHEAQEDRHYPLEILATGLFIPLLGEVDLQRDRFDRVAARVTEEVRRLSIRMDLPKRLVNSITELLRAQLYILFFHHLHNRVKRFVPSPWFDPSWRVHQLAFGHIADLEPVRALWMQSRRQLGTPIGGTIGGVDKRDIFSFRGKTGGGRHDGRNRPKVDDDDGDFGPSEITDED